MVVVTFTGCVWVGWTSLWPCSSHGRRAIVWGGAQAFLSLSGLAKSSVGSCRSTCVWCHVTAKGEAFEPPRLGVHGVASMVVAPVRQSKAAVLIMVAGEIGWWCSVEARS